MRANLALISCKVIEPPYSLPFLLLPTSQLSQERKERGGGGEEEEEENKKKREKKGPHAFFAPLICCSGKAICPYTAPWPSGP